MFFVDGQKEEPFISGHQEGSPGHEGIPHGLNPDPWPAPLLLHGRHRRVQAYPDKQLCGTGSCKLSVFVKCQVYANTVGMTFTLLISLISSGTLKSIMTSLWPLCCLFHSCLAFIKFYLIPVPIRISLIYQVWKCWMNQYILGLFLKSHFF